MSGILSPDVRNLSVGKGFTIFTPDTGQYSGIPKHLGNAPKIVYSPAVTVLPHFSAMAGTSVQDLSVITRKGGKVAVDMEEQTIYNLSLFFLGDVDNTNPDQPVVGIFDQLTQISGRLQFFATNDVGPRYFFDLTKVLVNPTGQFNPISEQWNAMTVEMTHVIDDNGLFGTITLQPDVSTIPPANLFAPFITGPLHQGEIPAFAKVGETMTCNIGGWIGSQRYAFQWFASGHAVLSGGTGKTLVPTSGMIGEVLTCQVTATNTNGSTVVLTAPTQPVHA